MLGDETKVDCTYVDLNHIHINVHIKTNWGYDKYHFYSEAHAKLKPVECRSWYDIEPQALLFPPEARAA